MFVYCICLAATTALLAADARNGLPQGHVPLGRRPQPAPTMTRNLELPEGHFQFQRRSQATPLRERSDDELFELLATRSWVLQVVGNPDPLTPRCPWHHPSVTWLVARCQANPDTRKRIHARLSRAFGRAKDSSLRFNAAVALAHLADRDALVVLDEKLLDDSGDTHDRLSRVPERTAAVYALADFAPSLDATSLRSLLARWFPSEEHRHIEVHPGSERSKDVEFADWSGGGPYLTQDERLVAGLLWAIVRAESVSAGYDASSDADVQRAAACSSEQLRRVAAVAFVHGRADPVPPTLIRLLRDRDVAVRKSALAVLGARPTDAGRELVYGACADIDTDVRRAAIRSLRKYAHPDTNRLLAELLGSDSDAVREAAADSAGALTVEDLVLRAATDSSFRVRAAAARALANVDSDEGRAAVRKLLGDRSADVQVEAVRAASRLNTGDAVPMLLEALDSQSIRSRETAKVLIARHWPVAASFPIYDTPARRSAARRQYVELWKQEADQFVFDRTVSCQPRERTPVTGVAERLIAWYGPDISLRARLANGLIELGTLAVPAIESFFAAHRSYPDADLMHKVLGKLDPVYEGLAALWNGDDRTEHAQLSSLKVALAHTRLTKMQAVVIAEFAKRARTSGVWLQLLPALETDAPAEAAALDSLALQHPDAMVRRTCCERITRRSGTTFKPPSALIAGLFDDPNPAVRLAALTAAGHTRDDSIIDNLFRAMRTRQSFERLAAAVSLHQLGVDDGTLEIERLSHHTDPSVRREVHRRIAQLPASDRGKTMRVLTRALDDPKPEVIREALLGLQQMTGKGYFQGKPGASGSLQQQIEQWKHLLRSDMTSPMVAN